MDCIRESGKCVRLIKSDTFHPRYFLPFNRRISFRKKGSIQKMYYLLSKVFFCELHNRHISSSKTPKGANSQNKIVQQKLTPCDRGRMRECSSPPLYWRISFVERGVKNSFFFQCVRANVRPRVKHQSISLYRRRWLLGFCFQIGRAENACTFSLGRTESISAVLFYFDC